QVIGGTLAADGVEQRIGLQDLAALEVGLDGAPAVGRSTGGGIAYGDLDHLLAETQGGPALAELVLERLDDLGVHEIEEALAALDEDHPNAEDRHHGGVLGADDAAADDDHAARQVGQLEDLVGGEDGFVVKGDVGGLCGAGAAGDDEVVGVDRLDGVLA